MSFTEQPTPVSIEELDTNFQAETLSEEEESGLRWINARQLEVEGQGWPTESVPYTRLPNRAEGVVRDAVWQLSRHSAGLCLRFISNTTAMSARWKVLSPNLQMDHMASTGVSGLDVYVRDNGKWHWMAIGRPREQETEMILFDSLDEGEREYLVYLPLYNGTLSLEFAIPKTATFRPAASRSDVKPIVFYGTSILHGGCASRPGMAYPALISRWLDQPHINLGFSGNGRSEPEVAALLAELDASLFVLDPLPNMQPEEVTALFGPLVKTIRAARPDTPIIAVENIIYQNAWIRSDRRARCQNSNAALREVIAGVKAEGLEKLTLIPGEILLGDDDEATVDGTHPTDVGFLRMAEAIHPYVKAALESA